jgi:hypothetical protein
LIKSSASESVAFPFIVLVGLLLLQNFGSSNSIAPLTILLGFFIFIINILKLRISYLRFSWPLLLFFLLGLINSGGHDFLDLMRDLSYALNPIFLIFIGSWMATKRKMYPLFFKIYIIFAFALAINHLLNIIVETGFLSTDFETLRTIEGSSKDLVVLSIALLFCRKKLGLDNFLTTPILYLLIMPILSFSFILSASRTEALILLILLSVVFLKANFQSLFIALFIIIIISFSVVSPVSVDSSQITFFSQLTKIFSEIRIDNYITPQEINTSWRGFESFLAKQQFLSGNLLQNIFGQGFGSLVDLGFSMKLAENEYQYIPVLHNGYWYILVKCGILGLWSYLFFYFRAFKFAMHFYNSINQNHMILSRIVLGCLVSIAAATYVVGGMPQMHNGELILLLSFLQYKLLLESKTY